MKPSQVVRERLRESTVYTRFRKITATALERSATFDGYLSEIHGLHTSRGVRTITRATAAKKLADASIQDQSCRSRIVEIAMTVAETRNWLAEAVDNFENYLKTNYSRTLSKVGCTTIAQRDAMAEHFTTDARRILSKIDSITEIGDMVIADIDKAAWAIRSCIDAVTVATKRETTL